MKQVNSCLHIGIADFAEPTLLLIGDTKSLSWLAEQIEARQNIKLAEVREFVCDPRVDLHLVPTSHSSRLTRLGDAFNWEISAVEAQKFALQLRELASATSPAHTYLDPESNAADVQLVASKGEYSPEKVFTED